MANAIDKQYSLESDLQKACLKAVMNRPSVFTTVISDRYTKGIADMLVCKEGKFYAIELKVKSNKTSKLQDYYLEQIRKAGGVGAVARTVGEFLEILGIQGDDTR